MTREAIPSGPPRPTLAGALAALEDEAHLAEVVAKIRAGRDAATARLLPGFLGAPALRVSIGTPEDMAAFFWAISA